MSCNKILAHGLGGSIFISPEEIKNPMCSVEKLLDSKLLQLRNSFLELLTRHSWELENYKEEE